MSTIVIVDDEAPFRAVLREILEPLGYRIVEAANGEEALERLHRVRADLVIADQRMPGMDGLTLLRRILRRRSMCRASAGDPSHPPTTRGY